MVWLCASNNLATSRIVHSLKRACLWIHGSSVVMESVCWEEGWRVTGGHRGQQGLFSISWGASVLAFMVLGVRYSLLEGHPSVLSPVIMPGSTQASITPVMPHCDNNLSPNTTRCPYGNKIAISWELHLLQVFSSDFLLFLRQGLVDPTWTWTYYVLEADLEFLTFQVRIIGICQDYKLRCFDVSMYVGVVRT